MSKNKFSNKEDAEKYFLRKEKTMLRMSFFDGTLDREKAKNLINKTEKDILYTYGLGYRNPTTHKQKISKERAIEIVDKESMLDVDENETFIHLNAYSENDLL